MDYGNLTMLHFFTAREFLVYKELTKQDLMKLTFDLRSWRVQSNYTAVATSALAYITDHVG